MRYSLNDQDLMRGIIQKITRLFFDHFNSLMTFTLKIYSAFLSTSIRYAKHRVENDIFFKNDFLSSYNKEIQQQKTKPENSNEVCFFLYPIFYTYPKLSRFI